MKNRIFFAMLVFFTVAAEAQREQRLPQFPSLEAVPASRDYARRAALFGWQDIAAAALWASSLNAGPGVEEKAASFMDKINAAAAELAAAGLPSNPKEKGEYVLTFIHRRFLKSYSEYQTRVDEIFVSGRYNCVSSALLFMTLGRSAGLDVGAVMTKDHAFATVNTGTELIDVETTNPYGFDPGNRKEFHDAFGKATGFAYVPPGNYRNRTVISGAELVSLILSNRISVLERANRFIEAVPLAVNRMVFLSGGENTSGTASAANGARRGNELFGDPGEDMMRTLFNLGVFFIKSGKEDDAIAWADYAGARFPDDRWQDSVLTAGNNKLVKLIRAKNTVGARKALDLLKPKLSGENYRTLDAIVLEAEAAELIKGIKNAGDAEAALVFLDGIWERLSARQRDEMRNAAILAEANRYSKERNWKGGMTWLAAAMERYGNNNKLEAALKTLRQNRVSDLHNRFAALFNKRDYADAKAAAQEALKEFPQERQLLQDLGMVERALNQ